MESSERLSFLENRHLDETTKRIIDTTLNKYIELQETDKNGVQKDRVEALKNALFIKFIGVEFELLFQNQSLDDKFERIF